MPTQEEIDLQNANSLSRQRATRRRRGAERDLRDQRDAALQGINNTADKRGIKAAYEGAIHNLDTSYQPSENKDDYESDIGQRGIDQFTPDEATPQNISGGSGGVPAGYEETDVVICKNGSPVDGKVLFKPDSP